MKRWLLILLLMTRLCWAADLYVDSGQPDNDAPRDGSTPALAERDISAALADCSGAGPYVIHVKPGTYSEAVNSRVTFGATQHGKTITVRKDAAAFGVADDVTVLTGNAWGLLYWGTGCYQGTFVWDGIDINSTYVGATSLLLLDDTAGQTVAYTLTVQNCSLRADAITSGHLAYLMECGIAPTRDVTFSNVVFNASGTSTAAWVRQNDVDRLQFTGCRFEHGTTPEGADALLDLSLNAGSQFNQVKFTDCLFIDTMDEANIKPIITSSSDLTGDICFKGCTFTHVHDAIKIPALANSEVNIWIEGCRFTLNSSALATHNCIALGDETETSTDTLGTILIIGNTFDVQGTLDDEATAMQLMRGVRRGLVARNIIHGQVVHGAGAVSSIGIYVRCDGVTFLENSITSSDAIIVGYGRGNVIVGNSLFDPRTDATRAPLEFRDGDALARQPINNIALYNVVQSKGSKSPVNFASHTGSMVVSSNVLDHNVYWNAETGTTGANILAIDIVDYTLTSMKNSAWPGYTGLTQWNDGSSVEGSPRFLNDVAGDLRIENTSAARGTQVGTLSLPAWNDKGAWQRKQRPPQNPPGMW